MNYNEAMDYIKGTAKFGSNLGLQRTERILNILGNPHLKLKAVHIGGTNGKGSTTAMITQSLMEAGYRVGMYTSPYLEEFEERIQIQGENIPKDKLASVVSKVSEAVCRVINEGYDHPTEFEIITCAMFLYFYEEGVDIAIIEVGLGGRLDSTNVILPILSIITSISMDHMQVLGDTITKIAYEKAGIIKSHVPLILYPQSEEALRVIEDTVSLKECSLIKVEENCSVHFCGVEESEYQRIKIDSRSDKYNIKLHLLGSHQLLNCATAVTALETLNTLGFKVTREHIIAAMEKVVWKGRLEVMKKKPLVVIDGAHNIDGIKKLKESVGTYFHYKKMVLILGILADKEVHSMVKELVPLADKVITVTPHSDRAQLSKELEKVVSEHTSQCESIENYEEAYNRALSLVGEDTLILISGSLYMIGDMRKIITRSNNK